ncbi:MAG TPA: hypothetical protein DEA08_30035 [Planctomycetes bacterium]|nr:hypothetical protein [Planctomycetota bacterium]
MPARPLDPARGQRGPREQSTSNWPPTSPSGEGSAWQRDSAHRRQGPGQTVRTGSSAGGTVRGAGPGEGSWLVGPTGTVRGSRGPGGSGRLLPEVGETLGAYQVVEVLGQGTMGRVYRAQDAAGRVVAIKALLADMADKEGVDRFLREGQAMAAIPPHPGVMRVHSANHDDRVPYLVMEFVDGQSLEDYLGTHRCSVREALRLTHALAMALAHIHKQGVVHRDLKPANVLLKDGRNPLLADFGLARMAGAERLTATGDLLGTPLYMPPEQVLGQRDEVDQQSDVWSLGVILYRLASGELPFCGATFAETADLIVNEEPEPLHKICDEAGPSLTRIVERALAKDKEDRYPDAASFAEDLAELIEVGATRTTTLGGMLTRRRRRQLLRFVGTAAVVGVIAFGAALFVKSTLQERRARALARDFQALESSTEQACGNVLDPGGVTLDPLAAQLEELRKRDEDGRYAERASAIEGLLGRGRFARALARRDREALEEAAQGPAPAEDERVIRSAILAQLAGESLLDGDARPLLAISEREDALGTAAKVLLARAWLERDASKAMGFLKGVTGASAELTRQTVRLFEAIDAGKPGDVAEIQRELPSDLRLRARRHAVRSARELLERAQRAREKGLARDEQVTLRALTQRIEVISNLEEQGRDEEAERTLLVGCSELLNARAEDPRECDPEPSMQDILTFYESLAKLRVYATLRAPENLFRLLFRNTSQVSIATLIRFSVALVRLDVPISPTIFLTAPWSREEERALLAVKDPAARYFAVRIRSAQPTTKNGRNQLLKFLELSLSEPDGAPFKLGPRTRAEAISFGAAQVHLSLSRMRELIDEAKELDPESYWVRSADALCLALENKGDQARALMKATMDEHMEEYRQPGRDPAVYSSFMLRRQLLIQALLGDREELKESFEDLKRFPTRSAQAIAEEVNELLRR